MNTQTLSDMSPAGILAHDDYDRVTIAKSLEAYVHTTAERAASLALRLQAATEEAERALGAFNVAHGIIDTHVDPLHERRPGDVIIRKADAREHLVLSVDATDPRCPRYLVVRYDQRGARPGDGAPAAWVACDEFLRP